MQSNMFSSTALLQSGILLIKPYRWKKKSPAEIIQIF